MGNSQSRIPSLQILKIKENSIAHQNNFLPFIHLITTINDYPATFSLLKQMHLQRQTTDLIFNIVDIRNNNSHKVTIPKGTESLGMSVTLQENAFSLCYCVLSIQEDSPAFRAGLIENQDYIIGIEGFSVKDEDEFFNYLYKNIDKVVNLIVCNAGMLNLRKVELVPEKEALLGCEIGSGMLYEIPMGDIKFDFNCNTTRKEFSDITIKESLANDKSLEIAKKSENDNRQEIENDKGQEIKIEKCIVQDSVEKSENDKMQEIKIENDKSQETKIENFKGINIDEKNENDIMLKIQTETDKRQEIKIENKKMHEVAAKFGNLSLDVDYAVKESKVKKIVSDLENKQIGVEDTKIQENVDKTTETNNIKHDIIEDNIHSSTNDCQNNEANNISNDPVDEEIDYEVNKISKKFINNNNTDMHTSEIKIIQKNKPEQFDENNTNEKFENVNLHKTQNSINLHENIDNELIEKSINLIQQENIKEVIVENNNATNLNIETQKIKDMAVTDKILCNSDERKFIKTVDSCEIESFEKNCKDDIELKNFIKTENICNEPYLLENTNKDAILIDCINESKELKNNQYNESVTNKDFDLHFCVQNNNCKIFKNSLIEIKNENDEILETFQFEDNNAENIEFMPNKETGKTFDQIDKTKLNINFINNEIQNDQIEQIDNVAEDCKALNERFEKESDFTIEKVEKNNFVCEKEFIAKEKILFKGEDLEIIKDVLDNENNLNSIKKNSTEIFNLLNQNEDEFDLEECVENKEILSFETKQSDEIKFVINKDICFSDEGPEIENTKNIEVLTFSDPGTGEIDDISKNIL